MKAHILFAILTAAFLLPAAELRASGMGDSRAASPAIPQSPRELLLNPPVREPPSTVGGIRTRDLAQNAPVPLIVVDREISTLAEAEEEHLRRPVLWLEEHPADFAHQWQTFHGLDARQEGNVLIVANPKFAHLLSRPAEFPDFGIGTLRDIHQGVVQHLDDADPEHDYVAGGTPPTQYYHETRRRSVPLYRLLLWDQEIETLEDYALWVLQAFPEYRLVVTVTSPSGQSVGEGEGGRTIVRVEILRVFRSYVPLSDIDAALYGPIIHHVAMASWHLLPGRDAWEVVDLLASSEEPVMLSRLASSLNFIAHHRIELPHRSEELRRSIRSSSGLVEGARRLAATFDHPDFLGRLREGLHLDEENAFHLLLLARLAAWEADPEALSLSREVLRRKETLEGDWKRFFSDTLRIYEIMTRSGGF